MGQDMNETTAEKSSTRTPLLLGGVVLAAVVAALLGYFVVVPMFAAAPVDETVVAGPRTPGASATPTPSPSATTLKAYRGTRLHDPFKPLVVANAGGSGSGSSGPGSAGTGSGTAATTAPTGTTTGSTTAAPTRVSVVEIKRDSKGAAVMIRLDTAIHIAATGETVADVLKVVSIKSNSATFLYGDSSFTLSVGQEKVLS
jgi:hypothetical protein